MNVGRDYFTLVNEAAAGAWTVVNGKIELTPGFKVPAEDCVAAVFIAPVAGVAGKTDITIGGTYAVGDIVKVTITSNLRSSQVWNKTYIHTVEKGATATADIASAINALIAADAESVETPYTSTVAASVITVTSKSDDKRGLLATLYTDSASGTITQVATAPTISEGQPDDLRDKFVPEEQINLAEYDTVRISYEPKVAQPFIDMKGAKQIEIFWFGTKGDPTGPPITGGQALADLINS